jgi:SAM-dependent methyltransferase
LQGAIKSLAGPLLPTIRWIRNHGRRRQYGEWLDSIAPFFGGFADKTVLEVGADLSGSLLTVLERRFSAREIVGLNLTATNRKLSTRARLEQGDIRSTRYADNSFDLIISTSAFEHIRALDRALVEMHRILKPGGYLFSHFGPIWSTSYGHHLSVRHGLRMYTYWDVLLPPYCHLLMTARQIASWLVARGYAPELAREISEYVTSSKDQNQLFFEDYEALFRGSGFEVLLFKGYDVPDIARRYNAEITPALLAELKARYPGRSQFFYDGIATLMRKRAAAEG